MDRPRILVILGSTRQGRAGEAVSRWLMSRLEARGDAEFTLVDLQDYPLPFFDYPAPPASGDYAPQSRGWATTIGSGDAFVIVTPEYNWGYPAVLKNALDYLYAEWRRKPVAFVSYGAAGGGLKAAEQLRSVTASLEMVPIKEQLAIPFVWQAFDESGGLRQRGADRAVERIVDELLWWAHALMVVRQRDRAAAGPAAA